MNKTAKEKLSRKQQILEVALDLFISKGIHGTSTREISKQAGISSGLMFHYFKNKEDLYESLLAIGLEEMRFDLELAHQYPDRFFEGLLTQVFGKLASSPFYGKMFVFIDQTQHTAGITDKAKEIIAAIDLNSQGISVIQKGQELGQFREGNPHALMLAFGAAIQGIAQEIVHNPEALLPDVEWVMDIIRRK